MDIQPNSHYFKYLIDECYEEDYDPFYAEYWYDNYCYNYTFAEWYFLYRKKMRSYYNLTHYKHTPYKINNRFKYL